MVVGLSIKQLASSLTGPGTGSFSSLAGLIRCSGTYIWSVRTDQLIMSWHSLVIVFGTSPTQIGHITVTNNDLLTHD